MFAAHRADSDDEEGDDDSEEEEEEEGSEEGEDEDAQEDGAGGDGRVVELLEQFQSATLAANADSSGREEGASDEDGEALDTFNPDHERIKRQVQKDRQARQKAGKRRSRNSSKLSIKGRLVHKNDW